MIFEAKDPENIGSLKRIASETLKFECSKYTDSFLKRRFEVRLRKNNIDTYSAYLSLFKKSKEEQTALKKELTIHVTHFFRDKDFWQAFKDTVIPKILSQKSLVGSRSIRIWSAGCSSGEEPLSIAICFHEKLKDRIKDFDISIIATDYDPETIAAAKSALYEESKFQESDANIRNGYFTKTSDNRYLANSKIRSIIRYSVADILKDPMPRNQDILFCRNTVIYFNRDAKSELYVNFYNVLSTGGFFIMGQTECLDGPARTMFKIVDTRKRIYTKV